MPPDNHLTKAILTTIFCCQPFGIVAIIFAAQVLPFWNKGQKQDALRCSRTANRFANIGIYVGLGLVAFLLVYYIFIFGLTAAISGF